MIIKALADYYQRLADDPNTDIAPPGFQHKQINAVLVINEDGVFENLVLGEKKNPHAYLVPHEVKRSGPNAWKSANLLWDHAGFVLGHNPENPDRGKKQMDVFAERVRESFVGEYSDSGTRAVEKFLLGNRSQYVLNHANFPSFEEMGGNLTFQLKGKPELICQSIAVQSFVAYQQAQDAASLQACLISGDQDVATRLHPIIRGVWGTDKGRGNIVAFKPPAFSSYGKSQGYNAPVGKKTVFAYTTALNHLLATETQRMQVGDASTVFWAKHPCDFESDFHSFLSPKKGEEAVSYEKIRGLLSAVKTGVPPEEADMPFYVLGLAPNASRIAIRFWHEGSVKEIKERVAEHFQGLEIGHSEKQSAYISLRRVLLATTRSSRSHPFGNDDEIVPNLAAEVVRAILSGSNYPQILLHSVIRRIKAEQANKGQDGKPVRNVTYVRAAIIKAVLNRKYKEEELSVNLDLDNMTKGYRLGRLFAVLEKIQWLALKDLNANLRDKFYSSASCTPNRVFPHLLDLSNKHLKKVRSENPGSARNREKEIHEIMTADFFSTGFPKILDLDDQGRFAVGYYHQKFYKIETEEKGEEV